MMIPAGIMETTKAMVEDILMATGILAKGGPAMEKADTRDARIMARTDSASTEALGTETDTETASQIIMVVTVLRAAIGTAALDRETITAAQDMATVKATVQAMAAMDKDAAMGTAMAEAMTTAKEAPTVHTAMETMAKGEAM